MRPPGGVPTGSLLKQSDGDGDAIGLLVATALPARDRAVAPFDRGSHHAAALSWADGDAAWANADGGVIAPTIHIVAVGAVPPDLNIDALGHLELLGLGWSTRRGNRQHRCGCRHRESDLHHVASSSELDVRAATA